MLKLGSKSSKGLNPTTFDMQSNKSFGLMSQKFMTSQGGISVSSIQVGNLEDCKESEMEDYDYD